MMTVMTIVFSFAMKISIENYPIYILSGIMAWNVFSQSLVNGVRCFTDNSSLMKKVKVPAWVFPTAVIGSACVHAGVALIPYFLIATFMGVSWHWPLIQLPFVFLVYFLFIEGLVLALGSLHVFFRDVGHVIEPALQILFYATPILYSVEAIPEKWQLLLKLNPMLHFVQSFRAGIYSGQWITWQTWAIMVGITCLTFCMGYMIFTRSQKRFLYYI